MRCPQLQRLGPWSGTLIPVGCRTGCLSGLRLPLTAFAYNPNVSAVWRVFARSCPLTLAFRDCPAHPCAGQSTIAQTGGKSSRLCPASVLTLRADNSQTAPCDRTNGDRPGRRCSELGAARAARCRSLMIQSCSSSCPALDPVPHPCSTTGSHALDPVLNIRGHKENVVEKRRSNHTRVPGGA